MRIVQLVNLVTGQSGGIRTAVDQLGRGYATAGHERHVLLPGPERDCRAVPGGFAWTLPGTSVPRSGGYRVLLDRRQVRRTLERLAPDVVEVSDRWTLTWVGRWASARGVRSVALVHEHLGDTIAAWPGIPPGAARRVARVIDHRTAEAFDAVVCSSRHSAAPFGDAATVVPLGVDLDTFHPLAPQPSDGTLRLVLVSRLSSEKRPELAVEALRHLLDAGVRAQLTVLGDGPLRARLAARAAGLPADLRGHVADRGELARTVARADVALCPCPIEAFGLAALESLACGTPVVTTGGGTRDLLEGADPAAGRLAAPEATSVAAAVRSLAELPRTTTQRAARAVAEARPWSRTVAGLLAVHGAAVEDPVVAA